jgi:hypothetical protein
LTIEIIPLCAITCEHPDEAGWQQHLMPHITWLQALDKAATNALIATYPFAIEGLIANMTVRE